MDSSAALPVMIMANSLHHGGAERFTSRLISGLDPEMVSVRLVLLRDEISYPLPEAVPVEILGYQSFKDLPKAIYRLRRLFNRCSPAVVLGTGSAVNTVIGFTLKTLSCRPAWVARMDTNPFRRDLMLRRIVLRRWLPLADALVANSKGLKDALVRWYPKARHKIHCIYNPVDFNRLDGQAGEPADWSPAGDGPLLVTVGRASHVKGWEFLLEVFAQLVTSKPAELLFCGDGPLLGELKEKARQMKLQSRVHFPGHRDNPFSIFPQADLFLLASEAEGLPNALIEAQGLGLCAVSSRCDYGPDEIVIHGRTGLLVDGHDASQWLAAINKVLSDDGLRKRMGTKARQMVRPRFDAQRRCRQWQELLLRVANQAEGPDGASSANM
jgi:N-acetylgalactosamine-N,N'-diacetylbacillosaminyl-diphospho-undecaprenol 4-alpha-N-acetylgalactosaminyltransferase